MTERLGAFQIVATEGQARTGRFATAHGSFNTPAFMPVGTQGTVKGVTPIQLRELGAEILLSNTYHLHLRPGDELIRELGGLHKFMGWSGPILTDSGGFQVFSLAKLRKLTDDGVTFQSHLDGSPVNFTPEKVIEIQQNLGVDIMMVLDECPPYPADQDAIRSAIDRTVRWAKRSIVHRSRKESLLFGIVQGGVHTELRTACVDQLLAMPFDGYAVGGLSVGEPIDLMYQVASHTAPLLPAEKPRYLMGQ